MVNNLPSSLDDASTSSNNLNPLIESCLKYIPIKTNQSTISSCMHDQMLESNRDDVKLEAMRCVTVMTAKGKLTVPKTLFPHVVKNVSSKNPELRKLIYLYLTSFADQEPDLALLPVATLQKSLKSPNPLVRSSALKVLTSMRLNILSAILMATLRNSVNDLSPYVRKTLAHSIIKIYRLEPELREDLIEYIDRLFNDKNSMVLSSAVASFEVVCPERLDLVHKHYRRFCFILADCNEWGQTLLLKLLMRYILSSYDQLRRGKTISYNPTEHDPKILLRSAKPLVHSHNSAVVMAVVKLYMAIANHNEVRSTITRPIIRLLNSHRDIQLTILNMIEELTTLEDSQSEPEVVDEDSQSNVIQNNDKVAVKEEISEGDRIEEALKSDELAKVETVDKDDSRTPAGSPKPTCSVVEIAPTLVSDNSQTPVEQEESVRNKISSENGSNNSETGGSDDTEQESDSDEDDNDDSNDDEDTETEDEEEEIEESSSSAEESVSEKEVSQIKSFGLSQADITANKDPAVYREIFRPYIKSFYVKHSDTTQIRLAKLRILTNLSSSVNVTQVLRELQAYVAIYVEDKEFVSAAIHAIGRCAIIVREVAHTCLNGLTGLLSNTNEHIVSEAIVVLRSQIIDKKPNQKEMNGTSDGLDSDLKRVKSGADGDGDDKSNGEDEQDNISERSSNGDDDRIASTVIKQVTKLMPTVTAPQARATILWILAEFCDKNITAAKCAPNVLRLMAKSFCQEGNFVKLQCLTLAAKFLISLDRQKKADLYQRVHLLAGYLFSLAKYDTNHDVRDRGRFLRKLLDDEDVCRKVLNGTHVQERVPLAIA